MFCINIIQDKCGRISHFQFLSWLCLVCKDMCQGQITLNTRFNLEAWSKSRALRRKSQGQMHWLHWSLLSWSWEGVQQRESIPTQLPIPPILQISIHSTSSCSLLGPIHMPVIWRRDCIKPETLRENTLWLFRTFGHGPSATLGNNRGQTFA